MIDIARLREDPEAVRENIKKKFQDHKLPLVDEALELDKQYRAAITRASELRSMRNKLSKEIGQFMREGKKEEAAAADSTAVEHPAATEHPADTTAADTTVADSTAAQ